MSSWTEEGLQQGNEVSLCSTLLPELEEGKHLRLVSPNQHIVPPHPFVPAGC